MGPELVVQLGFEPCPASLEDKSSNHTTPDASPELQAALTSAALSICVCIFALAHTVLQCQSHLCFSV